MGPRFQLFAVVSLLLLAAALAGRHQGNFHRHHDHYDDSENQGSSTTASSQPTAPVDDFTFAFALSGDVIVYPADGDRLIIPRPYPVCSSIQVFHVTNDQPQDFLLSQSSSGLDLSCFSHRVFSSQAGDGSCPQEPDYTFTMTVIDLATSNLLVDQVPMEQLLNGSLRELILQRTAPASIKLTFTQASAIACPSYLVLGTNVAELAPPSGLGSSAPLVVHSDPHVISAGVESYFYLNNMDGGNLDPAVVEATFIPDGQLCSSLDAPSSSAASAASLGSASGATEVDTVTNEVFIAATFSESGSYTMCLKDQTSQMHVPVAGLTVFGGNPAYFRVLGLLVARLPIVVTFFGSGLDAKNDAVKFIDYFNSCNDQNAPALTIAKVSRLFGAGGFLGSLAQGHTFAEVVFSQAATVRVCYQTSSADGFVEVPFLDTLDVTAQSYVQQEANAQSNFGGSSSGQSNFASDDHDQSSNEQSSNDQSTNDQSSYDQSSYASSGWGDSSGQSSSGWGGSYIGSSSSGSQGSSTAASSNIDESRDPLPQCPHCPATFLTSFGMNYVLVQFAAGQSVPATFATNVASLLCINSSFVVVSLQSSQNREHSRLGAALGAASGPTAVVVIQCDTSCNSRERLATLLWLFQNNQASQLGTSISSMATTPAAGFAVTTPGGSSEIPQTLLVAAIGAAVGVASTIVVIACCFMKRCCCFKRGRVIAPETRHSPDSHNGEQLKLDGNNSMELENRPHVVVGIVVKQESDGSTSYFVEAKDENAFAAASTVAVAEERHHPSDVHATVVRPQYHDDGMNNFDAVQ